MDRALADLIKISNATGKDTTLVAGGGGNTSVKTDDEKYMYIKASGTALKDMDEKTGWRRIRIEPVLAILMDKMLARLDEQTRETEIVNRLLLACDDNVSTGARPSVEAHLHALLDKCVIHLHPLVVAAYVSARNGRRNFEKLFKDEKYPPLWIPYADPGFFLARKIASLTQKYKAQYGKDPAVLVLQKHGLFVTAPTADAALRLVRKVVRLCSSKLQSPKPPKIKAPVDKDITAAKLAIRKAVFDATGQYLPVSFFPTNDTIAAFMARKDAKQLLQTPALSPDELVYANGSAMWLESCDVNTITSKLTTLVSKSQKPSAAFIVKGLGLFVAADKTTACVIADITNGSLLVRMWANNFGGLLPLSKRQQNFINNWEAETFRKSLVESRQLRTGGEIVR